jgi:hypothetical protein
MVLFYNKVWSYDFVHCRTDDEKVFRTLNILDEFSWECLAIKVDWKLNSTNVVDAVTDRFILRGGPTYICSDNGPKFIAQAVRDGSQLSVQRLRTLNLVHHGRTDTAKALTKDCTMNF